MYNHFFKLQNMKTKKFSQWELNRLKKQLEPRGSISDCAQKTGVHRTTITRVLKIGQATEDVVEKLVVYMDGFRSRLFMELGQQSKAA
jgi:hypothetical protein